MTEIPLDHIWVVPFGHTSGYTEHLRTLTYLPDASALKEKGKLARWVTGLTPVGNRRGKKAAYWWQEYL